jgi:hypothetical protein
LAISPREASNTVMWAGQRPRSTSASITASTMAPLLFSLPSSAPLWELKLTLIATLSSQV